MNKNKFIRDLPLEQRCEITKELKEKYPNRIPIFISDNNKKNKPIKLLLQIDMTISNILCIIRKRIELKSNESIYLFINKYLKNKIKKQILCNPTDSILTLYNKYKDEDDMLYIVYCNENTFG
jgi:hypothetical protein